MFKVKLKSSIRLTEEFPNGQEWSAKFDTLEQAQEWLEKQHKKADRHPDQCEWSICECESPEEIRKQQLAAKKHEEYQELKETIRQILKELADEKPKRPRKAQKTEEI